MRESKMADVNLKVRFFAKQFNTPCQKVIYLEEENELSNKDQINLDGIEMK